MSGYVWRDASRTPKADPRLVTHPRPLSPDQWALLGPDDRALRAQVWARTVDTLESAHEQRYRPTTRRMPPTLASLLAGNA